MRKEKIKRCSVCGKLYATCKLFDGKICSEQCKNIRVILKDDMKNRNVIPEEIANIKIERR